MRRGGERIDAHVRVGAMALAAFQRDVERIGRRHHHLGVVAHLPRLDRRPVVVAEHDVHLRIVEHTVGDHRLRAGERLLRWLKNQLYSPCELAAQVC